MTKTISTADAQDLMFAYAVDEFSKFLVYGFSIEKDDESVRLIRGTLEIEFSFERNKMPMIHAGVAMALPFETNIFTGLSCVYFYFGGRGAPLDRRIDRMARTPRQVTRAMDRYKAMLDYLEPYLAAGEDFEPAVKYFWNKGEPWEQDLFSKFALKGIER